MSSVVISGDTSGAITLAAPAVAGTNTITLPASTGTMLTTVSPGTTGTSMVLIGSATASNSASIDFTSLPASGYSAWKIICTDYYPSSNAQNLYLRISNGGTFQTANYWYTSRVYGTDGGAASLNSASDTVIAINGLSATLPSGGTVPFCFELTITNPGGTTNNKNVYGEGAYKLTSGVFVYNTTGGGYTGTTSALDGIRFISSSGNLATGNFYVYGIKNA